jgi:hypothetical protein
MKLTSVLLQGGLFVVIVAAAVIGVREAQRHVDTGGRNAITVVGSAATGEKVALDDFSVNIFTGKGAIAGLIVPNSGVGSSPTSFVVDKAEVSIVPWSVLWGPLHIRSIDISNPSVDLETSATSSNLAVILAAAAAYAVTADKSDGDNKKLRVDNLTITGAKLTGKIYPFSSKISITLPDIKINNMGTTGDGMTQADFVQTVLTEVVNQATKSALNP